MSWLDSETSAELFTYLVLVTPATLSDLSKPAIKTAYYGGSEMLEGGGVQLFWLLCPLGYMIFLQRVREVVRRTGRQ